MSLLPLSLFIFSLFAGSGDMGVPTNDVKGEIISRYKGLQVEESCDEPEEEQSSQESL